MWQILLQIKCQSFFTGAASASRIEQDAAVVLQIC